jgi:hypothetical protein
MSCECYKIGGKFIAEDPDCPAHGTEARASEERMAQATAILKETVRAQTIELGRLNKWMEVLSQAGRNV